MGRTFILLVAISGLLAVALGAFGAHGLKNRLTPDMLAVYQTGVQYHFYHTLALFGTALLIHQGSHNPWLQASAWLFAAGICIFSGSLYLLALSGVRWLGAITPLGGVAFMAGWLLLAIGAWRQPA